MTKQETNAILGYLEFTLISMVEKVEGLMSPENISVLYDETYECLNEIERLLDDHVELCQAEKSLPK